MRVPVLVALLLPAVPGLAGAGGTAWFEGLPLVGVPVPLALGFLLAGA